VFVCSLRYTACSGHVPYFYVWSARLYSIFPHYLINGTIFEKKVIEYEMCVSSFSIVLCETFLILREIERDMIKMYIGLHVKYALFLSDLNET
jgi:hypothetical protein